MRKIISILMTLVFIMGVFVTTPMAANASEDETIYVDGSALTNEEESVSTAYSLTRGVYMLQGSGGVTKPFTGWAGAFGSTTAHYAVYKLGVTITLQEYENGSWVSLDSWTVYEYNDYYVSDYAAYNVDGGTYYRVKTTHYAATDWAMAYTSGIWIS